MTVEYRHLLTERDGPVLVVTLNRPEKLNPLNRRMGEELMDLFTSLRRDAGVRAVVLTGAGRAFCSGGDIDDLMSEGVTDPVEERRMIRSFNEVVLAMRALEKPIIAAVNGVAAGGGAALAIACDIILASEEARIGFVFHRIGLSAADMGATYHLPRLIGLHRAAELLFTGDIIDAREADRIGLVNRVVPADRLLDEARTLAHRLASLSPLSLATTKTALVKGLGLDLVSDIAYEGIIQSYVFRSEDHKEGVRAFHQKRPPRFQGR